MRNIDNLNCILILDQSVKEKMMKNISDLSGYGVIIIENIRDITQDMLKKTRNVVILGSYRYDGLDDLKLFKSTLELHYYFISDDKILIDLLKDFCDCFYLDYRMINSNLLYSVLYNDRGEQSVYKVDDLQPTPQEQVQNLADRTSNEEVRLLCEDYIRLSQLLEDKIKREEKDSNTIRDLESKCSQYKSNIASISQTLDNIVDKSLRQNNILREYKTVLTKDYFDKLSLSSARYINKPKVLYFKEYEEIIHEKSFIKTLYDMFTIQGNLSTKIVRLHDSCDAMRIKKLEDLYYPVCNEFLYSQIINNDYIISYGNYKKLLDMLLTNSNNLDLLIIIDCKKFNDFVLTGDKIVYYLCRNFNTAEKFGLALTRTITNNSSGRMSWDTYENYNDLLEDEDKDKLLRFLTSREVMKCIYSSVSNS